MDLGVGPLQLGLFIEVGVWWWEHVARQGGKIETSPIPVLVIFTERVYAL
jgi:hypothetical protein